MRSTPKNREIGRVFAVALVAAALIGCPAPPQVPRFVGAGSETPKSGGTFVFHHATNVRSLDPHIAYDELSYMAIRLLFDGLLDYDYEGQLIPSLARALPEISEDGRTFTFHLREGVRFHNGDPLTAEDARFALLRMMSQETGSPGYPFFKSIVGAEAFHKGETDDVPGLRVLDPLTLEITLEEADQTFLNAMAMPFAYPLPRSHYEDPTVDVSQHPVGAGPFVFVNWERGVQLEFIRNTNYWQPDRVNPDRMVFLEETKEDVAVKRFRNGGIDAIHSQTASDYLFFKQSEDWKPYMEEFPGVTVYGFIMNTELPPFDNVHVRRAVAHAIDREGWARALNGRIQPAGQLLPPQIAGYDPDLPHFQRFDLERAREEMRLAGFPDGVEEPIRVLVRSLNSRSGELLQNDLARIGISVELRPVSFAVFLQETGRPKRAQAFFGGWNMDFPDPANFLDILFNSRSIHPENSENRSFYRNPELDRILDAARAEQNRETRVALYHQANDIVARDAPWAFLYYPLELQVWQPYVKGYRPHPIWSQDYRDIWLDLPRRLAPEVQP